MIEPAGHRVLVTPEKVDERTAGGLFLPDQAKDARTQSQIFGTVVAVGKNAFKAFDDGHSWCEVGDKIAFAKYGGFIIEDPETKEQFRLLNDEDVCAVIRS